MTLNSKEHYDLMRAFEKWLGYKVAPAREPKENQARGFVYCNAEVNHMFIGFRAGYALAKSEETL